ncbi:unnamed protein product, partial [Didymodactylos carnosus]
MNQIQDIINELSSPSPPKQRRLNNDNDYEMMVRNHDDKTQQDETNKLNDAIDLICEALKTNSLSIE